MVKYKIIDNFLREDIYLGLRYTLFHGNGSWGLKSFLSHPGDAENACAFGMNLYQEDQVLNFKYYPIVEPLIQRINVDKVHRAIVNLTPLPRKRIDSGIHTDHDFDHKVLLYYVNTNDGYTTLDPKGENIKIDCIQNRAVIFDGSVAHVGTLQTDTMIRMNVNITFNKCDVL